MTNEEGFIHSISFIHMYQLVCTCTKYEVHTGVSMIHNYLPAGTMLPFVSVAVRPMYLNSCNASNRHMCMNLETGWWHAGFIQLTDLAKLVSCLNITYIHTYMELPFNRKSDPFRGEYHDSHFDPDFLPLPTVTSFLLSHTMR